MSLDPDFVETDALLIQLRMRYASLGKKVDATDASVQRTAATRKDLGHRIGQEGAQSRQLLRAIRRRRRQIVRELRAAQARSVRREILNWMLSSIRGVAAFLGLSRRRR